VNFLHERQLRRLDAHGSTRAVEAPPRVSFEFFPPKNPQMEEQLWGTIKSLEPLLPQYVSVTYGAGGSTRDATFETVRRIAAKTHLRPAAHLTCVGHGRKDIAQLLDASAKTVAPASIAPQTFIVWLLASPLALARTRPTH